MGGSALAEKHISWIWHSEGRWLPQVVVRTPSGPRVVRTTKPTLEEARRWYAEQQAKGRSGHRSTSENTNARHLDE